MHELKPRKLENKFNQSSSGDGFQKWIIIASLIIGISIVILTLSSSFFSPKPTEQERVELQNLENKINQSIPLLDWEKERFCDLLAAVKGIKLFACKSNYFCNIGGLTGYNFQDGDLDLRGTGKTFQEALDETFKILGISIELFEAVELAKDINGKSGIVHWRGPNDSEVNIDSPHTRKGPNVFHIGYKIGKGKNRRKGHVLVDCVPYFRTVKNE